MEFLWVRQRKKHKELLVLAHINVWSVFTWWGHCNPIREWRAAYICYFHFKQAIEILKSAAGPTGVLVLSVEIRSPTRWRRTRAYTSSEFPNQTIQISSYRHVFCVVADLLSRSLKKKFQCYCSQPSFATNFKDETSLQAFSAPTCANTFQPVSLSSEKCRLSQHYF